MDVIERSRRGDPDSFAELYRQYKNLVFKTAYLILGDPADAEDVLQDVFVKLASALPGFDPRRASFSTWLYRITVNHCLNQRRKIRPDAAASVESAHSLESQVAADLDLARALSALSDKLRAAVVLRYYAGLAYDQIAEVLNVPVGTVKSRLNQAIQTMRAAMTPAPESLPDTTLGKEGI